MTLNRPLFCVLVAICRSMWYCCNRLYVNMHQFFFAPGTCRSFGLSHQSVVINKYDDATAPRVHDIIVAYRQMTTPHDQDNQVARRAAFNCARSEKIRIPQALSIVGVLNCYTALMPCGIILYTRIFIQREVGARPTAWLPHFLQLINCCLERENNVE